jgi:hypothetical protein
MEGIHSFAQANPWTMVGLVVLLVLIVIYTNTRKSGFFNPNPWNNWGTSATDLAQTMGGMDAGAWGSMWRPNTPSNNLPFDELGRIARYGPQMFNNLPAGAQRIAPTSGDQYIAEPVKEGFNSQALAAAYSSPDQFAAMKYLAQGPCGATDAGAAVEVQALTSMGCYPTYPYGAAELQNLIDQTDSLDVGLTPAMRNYQDQTTQGL